MENTSRADDVVLENEAIQREALIKPIEPTGAERWGLIGSYVIAYAYVVIYMCDARWVPAFAAMLCGGVALALRGERMKRESLIWLGCLWTALLCGLFGRAKAWGDDLWMTIHAFGAYWLLMRAGRPVEGGTSRYLPADLLYGLVIAPLRDWTLRLRMLKALVKRRGDRKLNPVALVLAAGAVLAAALMFCLAGMLLSDADGNFAHLMNGFMDALTYLDARPIIYLALSLPVGAYLYALVFGTGREPQEAVEARREKIGAAVAALRRVPYGVWPALLMAFSAMYVVFFGVQFSYLFDGLRGLLPEGYTASAYARQGFFELCGVMAVNFALLGMASVSAEGGLRARPLIRNMAAVLSGLSGLFAVIAASKLWLYIERFGLTPLRIQSAWLVITLFMGCAATLRHILTGRDSTKPWLILSGVMLALTHLY